MHSAQSLLFAQPVWTVPDCTGLTIRAPVARLAIVTRLSGVEIIGNTLLVSQHSVPARDLLLAGGYSRDDADKTVAATGFESLSRFEATSVTDLLLQNQDAFKAQIDRVSQPIRAAIAVTQTNSQKIPNAASTLHSILDLEPSALSIELVDGCNGFVKSLVLADRVLNEGEIGVIFAGDINSDMVRNSPAGTSALFGDGFALTLVRKSGLFESAVMQDGKRGGAIRYGLSDPNLHMDGLAVYAFSSRSVPTLLQRSWGRQFSDTSYPVFHQASQLIVNHLSQKLGVSSLSYSPFNAGDVGNLGAASIPGWMATEVDVSIGSEMVCVGFGAGLSWGFANIHWAAEENRTIRL